MEPLAAWIIAETGRIKQGNKSVGVAHQYSWTEGEREAIGTSSIRGFESQ